MKIVKYILSCISGCFDAYLGKGTNGGIKEGIVGLASMFVIVSLFLASLFFLGDKTKMDYRTTIACSIGITILFVGFIFLVLIMVEKYFL